jgi:hypothetical protein
MAWLTGWDYRQKLTLDTSTVLTSDVTNDHVILVKISSANTDFWDNVFSDGKDVRVTGSDGSTLKTYHMELFNSTTDNMVLWFKADDTFDASADIDYYLYYGNTSATDAQNENSTYPSAYKLAYHMKEGTGNIVDSTSTGADSTANPPSSADDSTGAIGNAITMNGSKASNDGTNFTINNAIWNQTEFTATIWYNTNGNAFSAALETFFWLGNFGSNAGVGVYANATGKLNVGIADGSGETETSASSLPADSDWHMITVSFSDTANNVTAWVDGVEFINATNSKTPTYDSTGNISQAYWSFIYSLDEAKFINYQFSSDESKLLYASENDDLITFGSQEANSIQEESTETSSLTEITSRFISKTSSELALFDDGDAIHVGVSKSDSFNVSDTQSISIPINWVQGKYNKSVKFNGLRRVTIPYDTSLDLSIDAFTICGWVKLDYLVDDPTFISKLKADETEGWSFRLDSTAGGSKLGLIIGDGTPRYASGTQDLLSDTWYHVAVTYSSGTVLFYVNGTLDKSTTIAGAKPSSYSQAIYLGQKQDLTNSLTGLLNDFLIFDEALGQTELQHIVNATGKVIE